MTDKTEPLDGDDLINFDDVTARIAYLEAHDCHTPELASSAFPCANGYECATCDETTGNELEDLRALAADMAPANEVSGRASALRDSYLEKFVREEADDLTGIGESYLAGYVKWDELAADRAAEMTEVTFRGTTYYITS